LYIYNKSIQQAICIGWGAFHVNRDELKIQSKILRDDKKDKTNYNNQIKSDDFAVAMSISFDFARITMTLLEKQHIGEVISSVWENDFLEYAKKKRNHHSLSENKKIPDLEYHYYPKSCIITFAS
jgi:aspartate--ammonia ligase